MASAGLFLLRLNVHLFLTWAWLEWGTSDNLFCLMPWEPLCCLVSAARWHWAWVPPEPAWITQQVKSYLLLVDHQGRVPGVLRGVSFWSTAAWLCWNSHLTYTSITTSLVMEALAGILGCKWGAEVVVGTTLHGWFSLLGIELVEQNCLVSSITESGNISDWPLLYKTRFKVPTIMILFSSTNS